jgi:hypothetical protein
MNAAQIKRLENLERKVQHTRQPLLAINEGETNLECLRRHGFAPTNYLPDLGAFTHEGQTYRATFVLSDFPEGCHA